MRNLFQLITICLFLLTLAPEISTAQEMQRASAPLFRDPVTDGAADPVVLINKLKPIYSDDLF